MIYAVCGTPGSYKSCYTLEKFVIPALAKGRPVYTNIEDLSPFHIATFFDLDPIDVDRNLHILGRVWDNDGNWHEDLDKVRHFHENIENNCLVVIDEAQNYFSSRDFKEDFSSDLIPFLTKHRHLGIDIIWITQSLESVDITFRRNTHGTYALRRLENLGMKNSSFVYVFDRADLEKKQLTRYRYSPDPHVFMCYSSYVAKDVKEERKSYNLFLRSPFFWLLIIALCFALYQVLSGNLGRIFGRKKPETRHKQKTELVQQKPSSTMQEVTHDGQVDDTRCIVKMATVHGEKHFYLDDSSVVAEPGGYRFCN